MHFDDTPADVVSAAFDDAMEGVGDLAPAPFVEYRDDPLGFLVDVLGIPEHTIRWSLNDGYEAHTWDGDVDPIVAVLEALARWENVGVESGTGTGKTYMLGAAVALWFLACWENAVVVTVAPKQDQLRLNLWKEVGKLWGPVKERFTQAELLSLQIRMRGGTDESWTAFGFVAGVGADEESASKARGIHAEHMLIIFEEMTGIHTAITTAFENTCTSPHNLRLGLGNPDNQFDPLHQFCELPDVRHVRISAYDHPNVVLGVQRDPEWEDILRDELVVPGAVSRVSIDRRARTFKEANPDLFDAMVRGISPKQAANALIKYEWVMAAIERWADPRYRVGKKGLGVDVANSEQGDKAAIAKGKGACLIEVDSFHCPDALQLGNQVGLIMAMENIDPWHVGVDAVGVGSNVVNRLRELRQYIRALQSGGRMEHELVHGDIQVVPQEALFRNLRSQMWWQMRDDLQYGRIALPPNQPTLVEDLCAVTFEIRSGQIFVSKKEEIAKSLRRSTDEGDAAVYWNFVRERRVDAVEEDPIYAWDPKVLEHEADECRRVRTKTNVSRRHMPSEFYGLA